MAAAIPLNVKLLSRFAIYIFSNRSFASSKEISPFVINRDISFACEILMRLVSRELILNIRGKIHYVK